MTQPDSSLETDVPPRTPAAEGRAREDASRKRFLRGAGSGGAAMLGLFIAACGGGGKSGATATQGKGPAQPPRPTDKQIVDYALTLEYLESDFYDKVEASGLISGKALEAIKVIGEHERKHVQRLRSVARDLGHPVKRPKTRFPLRSQGQVLRLAATFENLGAAAYTGQAANITSKELLAEAVSIATVEARHAAKLNELTGTTPTPNGAFQAPMSMREVLARAKPYIVG